MAGIRRKHLKHINGKSLIGRITPVDRVEANKKQERKEGYTVVNGKLVSTSDVGVLLRQATSKVEARKFVQSKKKNKLEKTGPKNGMKFKREESSSRYLQSKRDRGNIKNHSRKPENTLVISTDSDVSNKVLLFQNLALGVNQESLKTVLQQLSDAHISKVRVRDLPSGSATANVWLINPNSQELERVRKLFDGALVDGRTIKVTAVPESSRNLSY